MKHIVFVLFLGAVILSGCTPTGPLDSDYQYYGTITKLKVTHTKEYTTTSIWTRYTYKPIVVYGDLKLMTTSWHSVHTWLSNQKLKCRDKNGVWYTYDIVKGDSQ